MLKTYRIHTDINAENQKEVIEWLNEIGGKALNETGSMENMFKIDENILTQTDETTILELARVAISDAETYDMIAEKLDISDASLKQLQEKINNLIT